MSEQTQISESITELKSLVRTSLQEQTRMTVSMAEIKTKMDTIHDRGCTAGVDMVRDALTDLKCGDEAIHRRIDRQRNWGGIGLAIGSMVAGAIAYFKGVSH